MDLTKESTHASAKAGDITLGYYEAGEPTGVGGDLPLVMLHGGGPAPVTLDTSLELRLPDLFPVVRRWAPHPSCGCAS